MSAAAVITADKIQTKPCAFFNSKAGCRNGERCRFQHGSPPLQTSDGAEAAPPDDAKEALPLAEVLNVASLELETEMVKHVKVLTVDRRASGGFSGYYCCDGSKESRSQASSPASAYRQLREDLAAWNCQAVGVDLEGTSNLQVRGMQCAYFVRPCSVRGTPLTGYAEVVPTLQVRKYQTKSLERLAGCFP